MSKSTLKILPALMIAITAALVTQPMRATAIPTLVITEFSSTSLTAILNGDTANPLLVTGGNDSWTITLNLNGNVILFGAQIWTEGAAFGLNNFVEAALFGNTITVVSDRDTGVTGIANNTQDTTSFAIRSSTGSTEPLYVTFNDLGDAAAAPDTGTTASLFGLSLMGLAFLRRKLC
jgi:hypothetical protein